MDLDRIEQFDFSPAGCKMAKGFLSIYGQHIISLNHYDGWQLVSIANIELKKAKHAIADGVIYDA